MIVDRRKVEKNNVYLEVSRVRAQNVHESQHRPRAPVQPIRVNERIHVGDAETAQNLEEVFACERMKSDF